MTWPSKRARVAMLLAAMTVVAAGAEEPRPTATPAPTSAKSLSDVAGEIKLNTAATGQDGAIVISNQNLPELAGKGKVTEVTRPGAQQSVRGLANVQGTGSEVEGQGVGYLENLEKKQYWQGVYGQQLELLKDIQTQIDALDYEIPGLWRDFYSWDDPAYRDGVIKPKLDQALANRQKLEVELQQGQARLNEIKEQARREGAEPGWFRSFEKLPTPRPTVGVMPP